jgi:polyisoprenoid-binding protein YceI
MKPLLLLAFLCCAASPLVAQNKLATKNAAITFKSETSVETIDATSNQAGSIIDKERRAVAFSVSMRSFKFDKALMEEHFNEKYVHSDQYPTAKYKGTIVGDIDWSKPGLYKQVKIEGTMYFHGKEKPLTVYADIEVVDGGTIKAAASFTLLLADYGVEVPALVEEQVSKSIAVQIEALYKTMQP